MSDRIIIVGTGFAGLGMGIRLKQAGVDDFIILEQAGGVGGTWRDNRYPGAACDIESHLYSFSFEPNPSWSRAFASQPEILAYLEHCTDKYGLRPHIRFNCAATGARFDEGTGQWEVDVTTPGGGRETLRCRALIAGTGGLSRPSYPDIPGLDSFQGKMFHTARWDDSAPLDGKTVAVIGTGASAIQIVPAIAPRVGRMHLFQRTPPWIIPKPDRAITDSEQKRFRRLPALQKLTRWGQYLRHELMAIGFVKDPRILKLASKLALRFLTASVPDPSLRARLTPSYVFGCKRILLSNDYYPALCRENVELVTDGIEAITASGVRTRDGKERAVDAIILSTGFQAAENVAPFSVRGRGGSELNKAWQAGAEAFLGTTVAGFPNLFLIVGPNTGLGHSSMIYMIESQLQYILHAVKTMRAQSLRFVEVKAEAQHRYNQKLHARFDRTVWNTGCVSWYRTKDGKNTTLWPGFTVEYRLRTRRFNPSDYELVKKNENDRLQSV